MKVTDPVSDRELARFDRKSWKRGGTIALDGATYELTASGSFKPKWRWERDGRELVTVQETSSLGETKAHVALSEAGRADPNASLLLLLAVHLGLTSGSENAAAVAGGAVAGGS